MKKLDEVMELMADEMQDFKEGLLQLKKMTADLQNRSIPISTEVMEKHLSSFFQKQQEKEIQAADKLQAIDQKLKEAYILPRKLGMISGSFLILLVTLIGYLTFEIIQLKDQEQEKYQSQEKEQVELFNQYFEANPQAREVFENWLQSQNIP